MLSQKQEYELITSIKGRGEIPLKFAYIGEGAKYWDEIERHRAEVSGGIANVESELLRRRVAHFLASFEGRDFLNIVDIGAGNGRSAVPVLDYIKEKGIKARYVPVDISPELLEMAESFVTDNYPGIEVKPIKLDFERGNFSDIMFELKSGNSANLLLFLGTTLGNHSDSQRVLSNFRDSMSSNDYLIIGVELTNFARINKILPHYDEKGSGNFLYHTPESFGFYRSQSIYEPSWNEKLSQVEVKMILKEDVQFVIGKEKFTLEKDEQILLARSIKFTEWTLTKLLSDAGMERPVPVVDFTLFARPKLARKPLSF
jgi:uncharacterized SAM-dependent methyltransferase